MIRMVTACGVLLLFAVGCKSAPKSGDEKSEMQNEVREMARTTLDRLYEAQPKARQVVSRASGYAVFSNFGMKLGVVGSGSGKGVAVSNWTKAETFMRMAEVQAGLGLGAKKFSQVWIFETRAGIDRFVNSGWEAGAQASAAAKAGEGKGGSTEGALAVEPGVWLYQLTDAGLALELTAKGTKYYKDEGLN